MCIQFENEEIGEYYRLTLQYKLKKIRMRISFTQELYNAKLRLEFDNDFHSRCGNTILIILIT